MRYLRFPSILCVRVPQKAYREARAAQDPPPEVLNALIYRVTTKRILARQLEMVEEAIARIQASAMTDKQPSRAAEKRKLDIFRACEAAPLVDMLSTECMHTESYFTFLLVQSRFLSKHPNQAIV